MNGYPPPGPPNPYAQGAPQGAPPAAPPLVPQQHGVQLDPALAAEMARMQAALNSRQASGGTKRDDEWYSAAKPTDVGRAAESYILALPATMANPAAMPFLMTAQHHVTVRGQQTSVICPRRDAQIRDPMGANGPAPACPICEASEACFKRMYGFEKGTAEGEKWKQRGKDLSARDRCFMNVVDLDNIQTHWKADKETGLAGGVPKIWGFGPEVAKKLIAIAGECGPFWHPAALTRLKLIVTRTGADTRNIKYDCTITLPIAGMQIPQGYEGVLQSLIDLTYYTRQRPITELAALVPGYLQEGDGAMSAPPAVPNPYGAQQPQMAAPPPYAGQPYGTPQAYAPPAAAYQAPPSAPPAYPAYAAPSAPPSAPPAYPAYAPPQMPQAAPPQAYAPPQPPPTAPGYPMPPQPGPAYAPPQPPQMAMPPSPAPPWESPAGMPPMPPQPGIPPVPQSAVPAQPAPPAGMPPMPPMPALPGMNG